MSHDMKQRILDTYAQGLSIRSVAKELQVTRAQVITTLHEAGVMRRPGAVWAGKQRPELRGPRTPSGHKGTATPQEIVTHYAQGYSVAATSIMLDVPEWRVREAIHDADAQRAPSGKGGLVFSIKRGDFVARDFVWDLDDIVSRRKKGETWASIHKALGVTWHQESLIRHVTAARPDVKVKGTGTAPTKALSAQQLHEALEAHANGETWRAIRVRLGVSQTHLFRQLRAHKDAK